MFAKEHCRSNESCVGGLSMIEIICVSFLTLFSVYWLIWLSRQKIPEVGYVRQCANNIKISCQITLLLCGIEWLMILL